MCISLAKAGTARMCYLPGNFNPIPLQTSDHSNRNLRVLQTLYTFQRNYNLKPNAIMEGGDLQQRDESGNSRAHGRDKLLTSRDNHVGHTLDGTSPCADTPNLVGDAPNLIGDVHDGASAAIKRHALSVEKSESAQTCSIATTPAPADKLPDKALKGKLETRNIQDKCDADYTANHTTEAGQGVPNATTVIATPIKTSQAPIGTLRSTQPAKEAQYCAAATEIVARMGRMRFKIEQEKEKEDDRERSMCWE
ncbi:hypothetical protein LTR08_002442 [Meristemomyces frigidus]|nr:hypothetical protein LTR08_002442 [Meristemomyces frigidus]